MGSNMLWILLSFVGILHLTSGTEPWAKQNSFSTFSSQVPASSSPNRRVSAAKASYDYTSGFPHGFSQGLPTFDFTGPMASAGENKEQVQSAEQTENVGFVNGPPQGFPSLEQLGGKFPDFGDSIEPEEPAPSKQISHSYQQQPNYASSAPPSYSTEEDDDYLSGPGPSSVDGPGYRIRPESDSSEPSMSPYHNQRSPSPLASPSILRPPSSYSPVQASGSNPHSNYPGPPKYPRNTHSSPRYRAKKPVVLKVSEKNKRVKQDYAPPGPPVFYAPSPDAQSNSHPSQDNRGPSSYEAYRRAGRMIHRQKRSTGTQRSSAGKNTRETATKKPQDLKPAASESETFWELTSSPFILFDTYKNPEKEEQNAGNGNISFVEGGDADGGEQRFFPSFPAPPAPYLVGPFGGGPPARAPLFPGPAANRAPSRYHPQYAGHKFSPPPNRGPSNAYSAESHDHYQDNNLLGSGNFEVVRGGTYYGDDDDGYHGGGSGSNAQYHEHDDGEYYHHNGHSSPQEGYRVPGQDFFANFRDFADINPPSRAFSHRHEALAAEPRETIAFVHRPRQPKNILEKLENPRYGGSNASASPLNKDSDPMMATF